MDGRGVLPAVQVQVQWAQGPWAWGRAPRVLKGNPHENGPSEPPPPPRGGGGRWRAAGGGLTRRRLDELHGSQAFRFERFGPDWGSQDFKSKVHGMLVQAIWS